MQLSKKSLEDLRRIIKIDIGEKGLKQFTNEELNELGCMFLELTAIALKHKVRLAKEKVLTK